MRIPIQTIPDDTNVVLTPAGQHDYDLRQEQNAVGYELTPMLKDEWKHRHEIRKGWGSVDESNIPTWTPPKPKVRGEYLLHDAVMLRDYALKMTRENHPAGQALTEEGQAAMHAMRLEIEAVIAKFKSRADWMQFRR